MTFGPELPFQKLDVYTVAKEIARSVHDAKISDAELRDQATRASKSTFLCLCECLPNEGVPLRRKYFNEANNSLHETLGAMDLAATIGAARQQDATRVQELGVRLKRMLRALLHFPKSQTPSPVARRRRPRDLTSQSSPS